VGGKYSPGGFLAARPPPERRRGYRLAVLPFRRAGSASVDEGATHSVRVTIGRRTTVTRPRASLREATIAFLLRRNNAGPVPGRPIEP